jgi:hypothetical protein
MTTPATPRRAASVRTFHLVDCDADPPQPVPVPDGLSRLVAATADRPARCAPARAGASRAAASCLLEPVDAGPGPALLVLAPDHRPFRVNGHRLARIATVQESDTIQVDGGRTFRVEVQTRCAIGLAPDDRRGEACAVCRQPLGDHLVYLCPRCGGALHSDGQATDGDPDADALDCVGLLSECPGCRAPLCRETDGPTAEGPA